MLAFFRRKKVGVHASEFWKDEIPKFNTPGKKAELLKFAEQISEESAMAEIGFCKEVFLMNNDVIRIKVK